MKQPISTSVRVWPAQRQVISDYVAAMAFQSESPRLLNPRFQGFEEMVLSLPTCASLSNGDVIEIAVEGMLHFLRQRREQKAKGMMPPDFAVQLVEHYATFLESLPRAYVMKISLPGLPHWGAFDLEISTDIWIRSSAVAPQPDQLASAGLSGLSQRANGPAPFSATLELAVRGYASGAAESPGIAEVLAVAKQCAFLFCSSDALHSVNWQRRLSKAVLLDQLTGVEVDVALPERLAVHFGGLEPHPDLRVYEAGAGLRDATSRVPETNAEWAAALENRLLPAKRVFGRRDRPGFERIAAAIEWHQDSLMGDDQTMAFIAACIGLESIFGEEKQAINELSNRLVDRYAFMLGKDREEREQLTIEFREVLRKRGELVHAREKQLRGRDRQLLARVQRMLEQSVNHELRSFGGD